MLICWKARQIKKSLFSFETGDRGGRHYQYQSLNVESGKSGRFFCIHRLFIVDSISFHNIDKQVAQSNPDCIEILPGCMPKVLGWVTEKIRQPLIAGGLVCDEEDARNAINAGVVALSTTNTGVWTLAKNYFDGIIVTN